MNDRIEIFLASYNGSKYIEQQITSILGQTYQNIHLIIGDDCSTDSTVSILEDFKKRFPDKITIYPRKTNVGIVRNFSFLMEISEAEYMMFSDQDDIWFPDKVEKTYLKMKELEKQWGNDKPLMVFTDAQVIDDEGNLIAPSDLESKRVNPNRSDKLNRILLQSGAIGCTMMFNRALCNLSTPLPYETYVHDFWLCLVCAGMGKSAFIKEATMKYRQHRNQYVGSKEYNFSWFVDTFKNKADFQTKIEFRILQCQVRAFTFYKMYQNMLSDSDRKMVEEFVRLKHQSLWSELLTRFRYGFIPQGFWYGLAYLIGTIRMGRADPKYKLMDSMDN